ncbi:hypothetical protein [Aquipuribacter hungaricus]|uniref:DUF8175 domain-containing protein n=2 Tax=Aquipuribacter hungaricus TaxID=545624 RepID=A0ABV7WGD1_9MICO
MSAPEQSTGHSERDQAAAATRQGRRGLVLAGVFLMVVLAVGLFLAVAPSRDPEPIAGDNPSAAPVTSAAPSQATAPSGCELPAGDRTVPVTPPSDTEWELVGRVVAPTAPEVYGPGVTDPVRSCFARTPTGALYAAVNALATTTLPDAPRLLAEDLGAEGPGRDAALEQLPADGSVVPADDTAAQVQLAGFQFLSYTEDETVIDLAVLGVSDGQTVTAHTAFTLRWERGDWRVVHNSNGAPFSPIQAIPGLAGYVPWSGT